MIVISRKIKAEPAMMILMRFFSINCELLSGALEGIVSEL